MAARCNLCSNAYLTERELIRHVSHRHSEQHTMLSCHLCDSTFKFKSKLARHLESHVYRKEKPKTGVKRKLKMPENDPNTQGKTPKPMPTLFKLLELETTSNAQPAYASGSTAHTPSPTPTAYAPPPTPTAYTPVPAPPAYTPLPTSTAYSLPLASAHEPSQHPLENYSTSQSDPETRTAASFIESLILPTTPSQVEIPDGFWEDILVEPATAEVKNVAANTTIPPTADNPPPSETIALLNEIAAGVANLGVLLSRKTQTGSGRFKCGRCDREYNSKASLNRHIKSHATTKAHICVCGRTFHRKDSLNSHMSTCKHIDTHDNDDSDDGSTSSCSDVTLDVDRPIPSTSNITMEQLNSDEHTPPSPTTSTTRAHTSAINDNLRHYSVEGNGSQDPFSFLDAIKTTILDILDRQVNERRGLKFSMVLNTKFIKIASENEDEPKTPHFRSFSLTAVNNYELEGLYSEACNTITNSMANFSRDGSGYTLEEITSLDLDVAQFTPLRATSYMPLPPKLYNKKCIVNINNHDNQCFKWSILAKIHPVSRNPNRVSNYYEYENELNFTGIQFPVCISAIPKFEKLNDISVNVFGYEDVPFPLHITRQKQDRHVDLLWLNNGENNHYCLIKNLDRFLAGLTKHGHRKYFCNYCLHGFSRSDLLREHEPLCRIHGAQRVRMPTVKDSILKYRDYEKQLKVPFTIFADFESITEQISTATPDPNKSYTEKYQKHTPCSFAYIVVATNDDYFKPPTLYRGPDAVDKFIENLLNEERWIKERLDHIVPMEITEQEEIDFDNAVNCHICNKTLGADRCRDHDHTTGAYRGPAHNSCNLHHKYPTHIPIVMHNLRGYDSHLIMQGVSKLKNKEITCIPNTNEKYISFSIGDLRFIDSYQFTNAPLDKLVGNLATQGQDQFKILNKCYGSDKDKKALLLRKGVYPYDYMSSFSKFDEQNLPDKKSFYNILSGKHISDEEYEHAQSIWNAFGMSTMAEYHDLYLLTDCILLADVFENYRKLCLDYYKLDPCHFYTAPGMAWQACLKMTGIELELLTDVTKYNFIEGGMRGGISVISKRLCEANNPYLDSFDENNETSYIMYYDFNNLYGGAMSAHLPTGAFQWLTKEEIDVLDITQVSDEADQGYILEVDLSYPEDIHYEHNQYPLAVEKCKVTEDMLSQYSKNILNDLNIKHTPTEKLVPNLKDKTNYIIHYRNLKQCLALGLHITKIHRALIFKQSNWLKQYIDFNTKKRASAKNDFEKDFFKLMNNCVFGKCMENIRKRVNIKLVTTEKQLLKLTARPSYKGFKIFDENFVAVTMSHTNLYLNRPSYIGFCILDISKVYMYHFHYNYVRNKYGDKAELAFTDTDSLLYIIRTKDVYVDMKENLDIFDTSDYPTNHPLYSLKNKKKLYKMKDEAASISPISEFVGLRPKMYSLKFSSNKGNIAEKKTAKGISKSVTKHDLRHQDYKECLMQRKLKMAHMKQIRSYEHQLYSISVNKVGLSPYDDKRYILDDGVNTLAHGHRDIPINVENIDLTMSTT